MSTLRSIHRRARRCAGRLLGARSRSVLAAVLLAVVLVMVAHPFAMAGNDTLANVAPPSQLPGGSLSNAYPLGNYALDHHFDAVDAGVFSGVDVSGIAPTIAWFLAQTIWMLTAFLANALILLFTFAFSLDLVNGSNATGGAGALEPIAVAVRTIYRDVFGQPWLVVGVLLTGMWAIWNALVRRRYTETAGALAVSLVFVTIALAFVTRPEIIGQASRWTNQMSSAFLALSTNGDLGSGQQAKQADADQLFSVLIFEPWTVLNFGGLEHCISGQGDSQRSVPVRPLSPDPARDLTLARRLRAGTQIQADGKTCVNHRNKYAAHFLRFAPETDERNAEYDALKDGDTGKLPDADPGKTDGSYRLGDIDKPAADAMGKGGQYQRLLLAIVIFVGQLGAFLLLGALSVVVIVAQVLVLLLLAFAPVALVLSVFPGRGHDFFKAWLARLASYLLRKAIYSLLLAILLAVASALADATSSLGWLMAYGLQAVFFWTVLLNRNKLAGQLSRATTGDSAPVPDGAGRIAAITYAATRLASRSRSTDPPPPPPPPPPSGDPGPAAPAPQPPPAPDSDHADGIGSSHATKRDVPVRWSPDQDHRTAADERDGIQPPPPDTASSSPTRPVSGEATATTPGHLPPQAGATAIDPAQSPDRLGHDEDEHEHGLRAQGSHAAQQTAAPDHVVSYDSHAAPDLAPPLRRARHGDERTPDRFACTPDAAAGAPELPDIPSARAADAAHARQRAEHDAADADLGARDLAPASPLRAGLDDDARRLYEHSPIEPPSAVAPGTEDLGHDAPPLPPVDGETGR